MFMCAHVCVYEQVCVSIYMCVNVCMHVCVSKGLIILESEIHRKQCLKPKPMCFYLPDEKILEKQERGVGVVRQNMWENQRKDVFHSCSLRVPNATDLWVSQD